MPAPLKSHVQASAAAVGCDPAYVLLPILSALGAAIGTTTRLEVKPGWYEPPVLWTGVVGESGSGKTPAQELAVEFIEAKERDAYRQYDAEMGEYEKQKLLYEVELTNWKRSKEQDRGDSPQTPQEPICQRYVVSDITIESLG